MCKTVIKNVFSISMGILAIVSTSFLGCSDTGDAVSESVSLATQAVTGGQDYTSLRIPLPAAMPPQRVAVAASNELRVSDRARVQFVSGKPAQVVNIGTGTTYIGVSGTVGNLWSAGYVDLRPNALVDGNLTAESTIHYEPGASVTGTVKSPVALGTLRENAWAAALPTNQQGGLFLEPNTSRSIEPGVFNEVSLKQNARVSMSPGIYRFGRLTLEPGSRIELSSVASSTIIYVDSDVTIRGKFVDAANVDNTRLPLLIVSLSANQVPVEVPFNGTLFVPNGKITLSPGHYEGAFFAKDVELAPDVVVTLRSFPFSEVLPQEKRVWAESPVNLTASVAADGTKKVDALTTETAVTFTIPDFVKVYQGNAGTGAATLKFKEAGGAIVTCAYVGNAPVAHPTEEIPILLGQRYRFVSCDNQRNSGDIVNATWFQLTVDAGDQLALSKETIVQVHLGGGCSDSIEPAIAPVEVAALRQEFNWKTAKALPETDPDGNPALRHGLIYIDRPEQLQALDRWRVFYDARPISKSYSEEYHGKCGRVEHSTDGKGVIVYAIFPAKLFNLMRNVAIEALAKGAEPPFKMIIPSTPDEPEHVNADGSLRYSSLGYSGYGDWLQARAAQQAWFGSTAWKWTKKACKDAVDWCADKGADCVDYVESGFDYALYGWNSLIDWGAQALDDGWELTQEGLQWFVLRFEDSVTLRADIRVANLDKMFPKNTLMTRPWGPSKVDNKLASLDNRPYIFPTHASFRVRQWGWGFLPTMDESEIDVDGHTKVKMIRDENSGGSDADFCIKLETDYAMMTTDLIPNEVCYFNDYQMYDFLEDSNELIVVEQNDIMTFTELRDSYMYAKTVMGAEHPRMDILIGWPANAAITIGTFGVAEGRAMCLCLDFPGLGASALTAMATAAGGPDIVSQVLAQLSQAIINKDLWWPDASMANRSRGVITHEYGHYNMCALMYEMATDGGWNAPAMLRGLLPRIWDGEKRTSEKSVMCETFADTFSMQVMGGSNYAKLFSGSEFTQSDGNQSMIGFCNDYLAPPQTRAATGLDWNYFGTNDCYARNSLDTVKASSFHDEVCRMESLVFDAFDNGTLDTRTTASVTKGDFWHWDGTNLSFAPQAFIASDDEPVALSGGGWKTWVSHYLEHGRVPNKANVLGGLVDAMISEGNTWCDACEVLAIHNTATPAAARMTDTTGARTFDIRNTRWQACLNNTTMRNLLPEPPEEYGNIDPSCQACPPRNRVSTSTATCIPCGANQISRGNECVDCDDGEVPTSANECSACTGNSIAVGSACVACPAATTPNAERTACVPCAMDATIDWAPGLTSTSCINIANISTALNATANDNCPDQFWVEFKGIPELVAHQFNDVKFSVEPYDSSSITKSDCSSVSSYVDVWRDVSTSTGLVKRWLYGNREEGTWIPENDCDDDSICLEDACDSKAEVVVDLTDLVGMSSVFVHASALHGGVSNGVLTVTSNSTASGCGQMQ